MKTALKLTALAAGTGLLAGLANAQTSPVVGFETWVNDTGFNFVGVRLHQNPIASGQLETATTTSVTDSDIDLAALITSGTYLLEIEDGSGIVEQITAGDGLTGLTTINDLSGLTYPLDYSLRPADTIESIFGSSFTPFSGVLDSGLAMGSAGTVGADQVWIWNGSGFDQYYADEFAESTGFTAFSWVDLANTANPVDPTTINLLYSAGFVISSAGGNDIVVSGDLKAGPTELMLDSGFNFVGAVAPVGATLETAFGSTFVPFSGFLDSGLAMGSAGTVGADQVWIWNGSGFDQYYADEFAESTGFTAFSWVDLANTAAALDPTTVSLGSGYVISAAGAKDVTQGVPSYYTGL